jgi:ammonium transporter, Amt family
MITDRKNNYPLSKALMLLCSMFFAVMAMAQTAAPSVDDRLAALEKVSADGLVSRGDNAWMLICSALVLLMTGPGLALFYGGLVRRKNILATMMQSFVMMAVITVIWAIFGYSFAFGKIDNAPETWNLIFGGLDFVGLRDVGTAPNTTYAATIPHLTFMVFQLMFAIITPALITGAFAERMKFSAMLAFCTLWSIIVYFPLAHMVWGDGGMFNAFLGGKIPALDFAGGTVVHISSGFSALVCAIYLGKRIGYPRTPFAPHNLVLSVIGACLLWVGWFGFNAGSAVAANGLAANAFVTTHFGAAAAALGWLAAEWLIQGKPTVLGGISGAVAGLVGITPAAGFVTPMSALAIGLIAGVVCFVAVTEAKKRLGYDDSLDAFGVHGVGGFTGAILTGIFAHSSVQAVFGKDAAGSNLPVGLLEGNGKQVINQLIASLIAAAIGAVGSLVLLFLIDKTIGLRVSGEDEITGLDLSQHGEEGYNFDTDMGSLGTFGSSASYAATGEVIEARS